MSTATIPSFNEIIRRKRDGETLDRPAIDAFVGGLADGSLALEQAAAMTMAIFLKGMDFAETAVLTQAMTASGDVLDWTDALPGPALDKHSTGGIGDKVSLMLAPIVAACGGYVPMIAGRGLGHTGGTIDKLSSIPGYRTHPDLDEFQRTVRDVGCAIIGQTRELAPADRRLYAIRDVTATIESLPLITGSILSKKLAAGVQGLVMDIKIGSGAFMADEAEARALAEAMGGTAAAMGLPMNTLITDMNQILGTSAGNAIEVRETIDYLSGAHRDPRLHAVTIALAAEMLVIGGLDPDRATATARVEAALRSGHAAEIFARMIAALGGPADLIDRPDAYLPTAPVVLPIYPERAGYLVAMDGKAIGEAIIDLGGGRRRIDDAIDPAAGFSGAVAIGTAVDPAQPIAFVHAASDAAAQRGLSQFRAACIVESRPPPEGRMIHAMISNRDGVAEHRDGSKLR